MTVKNNKESTEQERADLFILKYNELCEKHGFKLSFAPSLKLRDDNSWSIVMREGISRLNEEQV